MLHLRPTSFAEAADYIKRRHRHLPPPVSWKFGVAVADEGGNLRGVAIVGRPVARHLDDGWTVEVTRCCTDGARNAASMLYGAAWRAAKALGYRKLVTYTLQRESGVSLRASGAEVVASLPARAWHTPSRPRAPGPTDDQPKLRWEWNQ